MAKLPTPQMLVASRPAFPDKSWLDTKPEFMPGSFCYPAKKETMELLHMPNPHEWDPAAEDWNLPENWEKILCDAFADRLEKATLGTINDGIMTKDLVGLVDEGTPVTAVNSSEFIGAIHDRLAAKL